MSTAFWGTLMWMSDKADDLWEWVRYEWGEILLAIFIVACIAGCAALAIVAGGHQAPWPDRVNAACEAHHGVSSDSTWQGTAICRDGVEVSVP